MTTHEEYTAQSLDSPPRQGKPVESTSPPVEAPHHLQRDTAPQSEHGAPAPVDGGAVPGTASDPSAQPVPGTGDVPAAPPGVTPTDPTPTPGKREAARGATGFGLFGADELSDFRGHWDQIQVAFVDDPRQCVQKADALVSTLVDRLSQGFAATRAELEEQWSRGEEASTEDLRQALKRYREFFQRLLSV